MQIALTVDFKKLAVSGIGFSRRRTFSQFEKRSQSFCYSCYKEAHSGICESCRSDDLMRLMLDFGCDWVIKYILESEITPVDLNRAFEDSVRECYPEEVSIGWLTLDSISVMKSMDPISWQCAQSEWEDQEANEGNIISFDGGLNYYYQSDIENFLDRRSTDVLVNDFRHRSS